MALFDKLFGKEEEKLPKGRVREKRISSIPPFIDTDSLRISPDGKRLAFFFEKASKMRLMLDGLIVAAYGGGFWFDSPDSLHYIAAVGVGSIHTGKSQFVYVEERLKR